MHDSDFMKEALRLAAEAAAAGEVPVGCVIARGDEIAAVCRAGGCGNAPSMSP